MVIRAEITVKLDNDYVDMSVYGTSIESFLQDYSDVLLDRVFDLMNDKRDIYIQDDMVYTPGVYYVGVK